MEKTLEIHLKEQREAIAYKIETLREEILAEAKALGADALLVASRTLMICADMARTTKRPSDG